MTTITVRMTADQLAEFVFALTDCPWKELQDGNVWRPFDSMANLTIDGDCPEAFHISEFGNEPWEGYAPSDVRRVTWRSSKSGATLEAVAVKDSFEVTHHFDPKPKQRETVDMLRRVLTMSTGVIACDGDSLSPVAADIMRGLLEVPWHRSFTDRDLALEGE